MRIWVTARNLLKCQRIALPESPGAVQFLGRHPYYIHIRLPCAPSVLHGSRGANYSVEGDTPFVHPGTLALAAVAGIP